MLAVERAKIEAAVLQANARFYTAFTHGDQTAMEGLWAKRASVTCLHPGSPPLSGRGPVLESWRQILRERPPFALRCDHPVTTLLGDLAIVVCYEAGGEEPAHLVATNVFVLEDDTWRMVHHHAGPLSSPAPRRPAMSRLN